MENINKFIYLCSLFAAICVFQGCSYNELPPKTDDATNTYTLPKGVLPTAEERAVQQAARDEYNNFINNKK